MPDYDCADCPEVFHRISDAKIWKYITLKRGCAYGHDGILAKHLKKCIQDEIGAPSLQSSIDMCYPWNCP